MALACVGLTACAVSPRPAQERPTTFSPKGSWALAAGKALGEVPTSACTFGPRGREGVGADADKHACA